MNRRADEIRKRIAERKKKQLSTAKKIPHEPLHTSLMSEEEKYGFPDYSPIEYTPTTSSGERYPFFRKERFFFKVLASACLVLIVAILFKSPSPTFEKARTYISTTMDQEFQFAAVSSWYEDQFGKPLTLLPQKDEPKIDEQSVSGGYVMPASGKVMETFEEDKQGVTIQTGADSVVEAMSEGIVRYVGKRDGIGNTVIIQHADGSETWYGQLKTVDVNVYDFVNKGKELGVVASSDDGETGLFYFAIKKGEKFVDPSQVIQFE
ncbi:M23 family metallopeptidase [Priestia flexa]|uniref:M23 family metallopeptidase n=1 Tax=Priestia flexa TaxID=86664 RepID=UPI001B334CD0|nr:M23 family metallopeptidase [Priestia flexa]